MYAMLRPTTTPEAPQLQIDDRVQLIHPVIGVVVGTRGTILQRFLFDSFYDICFDGYPAPRLVNKRDVTAAPEEASVA